MQFVGWHAPCKITNCVENLILQVLQFQEIGVCYDLTGGAGIRYYWLNESFMDG